MKNISDKQFIKYALIVALIALCVINIDVILGSISKIYGFASPVIVGFVIAFVMNVLLRAVEGCWDKIFWNHKSKALSKAKRPVSIILCLVIILGIMFAIVFLIAPWFRDSFGIFVKNVPAYADNVNNWWAGVAAFAGKYGIKLPKTLLNTSVIMGAVTDYLSKSGTALIESTVTTTTVVFSKLVNAIISFILAIYIVADKERIAVRFKKFVRAAFHEDTAERIFRVGKIADTTFSNFISGQCIEACAFGLLSYVGMMICGFPFAGMIAVVLGFTTLIPVLGAFIGAGVGFILIFFVSPIKALWFIVFIIVIQQIDQNLVYPRIVGKSVGLPGLLVLISVTIGGAAGGVVGMLVSVPLCALLCGFIDEFVDKRLKEKGLE